MFNDPVLKTAYIRGENDIQPIARTIRMTDRKIEGQPPFVLKAALITLPREGVSPFANFLEDS